MKAITIKKLILATSLVMASSCMNKAKQNEAATKNFTINNTETLQLLANSDHKKNASAVTVFWIPETHEQPGVDYRDLPEGELERRRLIAKTIVDNSRIIDGIITDIKIGPQKCGLVLTAYGCFQKKEVFETRGPQIPAIETQLEAGQAAYDAGLAQATGGLKQILAGLLEVASELKTLDCVAKEERYQTLNCIEDEENEECVELKGAL
ncbi:MAG: hypothetical protein HN509_09830, partial [Halobacteriovoraceae bacterium]|nr:hypothetical protein [Halobacteriovoraceae bacterium]